MSVSVANPTELRASVLGLSNRLFCNSPEYAAKITAGQVVTRKVSAAQVHDGIGLDKARAKVQASGYNGKMSRRTKTKVTSVLAEWVSAKKADTGRAFTTLNASARSFTFVTLTLCAEQFHTDNWCKRHLLGRFIQECGRQHGMASYFWRAEPQKNGNIHFHLLLAQRVPWEWIRATWNGILEDAGYLGAYRWARAAEFAEGFRPTANPNDKRTIPQQVAAWRAGEDCGWSNPNSTDIHALNKVKNAAAYVCKYVSKEGGGRKIEGRIWGCSDDLRHLKTPEIGCSGEFLKLLQEAADSGAVVLHQYEHVAVYTGDIAALLAVVAPELVAALETYYRGVSVWLRNLRPGVPPPR